jgi:membrane-bound serine protease (ClpP class)
MLVDVADASIGVDPTLAVASAVTGGAIMLFLGWLALRAARRPRTTGMEALVGEEGEVVVELAPEGKVLLHGEFWHAVGREPLPRGTRVRCVKAAGMLLDVEAVSGGGTDGAGSTGMPEVPAARKEGTDER